MAPNTTSFSWLHLTDLHCGMKNQDWLWPNVREIFFADLKQLYERCGPWDLVIFTGDLTQKGHAKEFQKLNEMFDELWEFFGKLKMSPGLLAVPGNHDLLRPTENAQKKPAVKLLLEWGKHPDIHEEIWGTERSAYRSIITKAFKNYSAWWENCPHKVKDIHAGMIPGDFSATIEKDGAKLGIVGLNTGFLQLTGDNYEGRLGLHTKQFHGACPCQEGDKIVYDGVKWVNQHHVCLLLTHHPPAWLHADSLTNHLYEHITAHGRFAVHLCGHMHKTAFRTWEDGGVETRRLWQGRSLFSVEPYGKNHDQQRLHGYTVGKIEIHEEQGTLQFWPREARLQGNERNIVSDQSIRLTDDAHTSPVNFQLRQPYQKPKQLVSQLNSSVQEEIPMPSTSNSFEHYVPFESDIFVNRKKESAIFFDILQNRPQLEGLNFVTPKTYLAFHGIAGQGKSSLLKWIGYNAKEKGYCFAYIDFEKNVYRGQGLPFILEQVANQLSIQIDSDSFRTFKDFLLEANTIPEETLIKKFRADFDSILKQSLHKGVVLCFDSTEKAESRVLDTFEEHVLVHYIKVPNFMLVTAGQENRAWKRTELKSRIDRYRLPCLDIEWIVEQVEKLANKKEFAVEKNPQPILSKMLQLTLGHPLSNFTLIQFWTEGFSAPLTRDAVEKRWSQSTGVLIKDVIEQRVLEEFHFDKDYPSMNEILQYLSFPRHIDIDIGCYILANLLEYSSPYKFYWKLTERLQQKSILFPIPEGNRYRLNTVVRNIILQHMRINKRQEYLTIQQQLSQQYHEWAIKGPDEKKIKHTIERLYHKATYLQEAQPDDLDMIIRDELVKHLEEYAHSNRMEERGEVTLLNHLYQLRNVLKNDEALGKLTNMPDLVQIVEEHVQRIDT